MLPANPPPMTNDDAPMSRVFKIFGLVVVFTISAVVGGLIVIISTNATTTVTQDQTKDNGRILEIMVAVTGCTPEHSPEACTNMLRDRDIREGTRRIAEVDCVHRRQHAGLPAPEPGRFCIEQTPPEVYPG